MPAAAAASAATAMAAAAATTTARQSELLGGRRLPGVFLVKDVKCREADVGDFLLAKENFVTL
jgi:hypothetical protein